MFKYDGIPVQHITTRNGHYLLLLIKGYQGQYTELALLSPNYYAINVYYLDVISNYQYPLLRLWSSIDRDLKKYEKEHDCINCGSFVKGR